MAQGLSQQADGGEYGRADKVVPVCAKEGGSGVDAAPAGGGGVSADYGLVTDMGHFITEGTISY